MAKNVKRERIAARAAGSQAAASQTGASVELPPQFDVEEVLAAVKSGGLNFHFPLDNPRLRPFLTRLENYLGPKAAWLGFTTAEITALHDNVEDYSGPYMVVYERPNHTPADEVALEMARIIMVAQVNALIDTKLRGNLHWTKVDETAVGFGDPRWSTHLRPPSKTVPVPHFEPDGPGQAARRLFLGAEGYEGRRLSRGCGLSEGMKGA